MIDTTTNTIIKEIIPEEGGFIYGITVNPDGSRLYATQWSKGILIIDTATNEISGSISVTLPRDLAFSPDGSRLYVVHAYDSIIYDKDNFSIIDMEWKSS